MSYTIQPDVQSSVLCQSADLLGRSIGYKVAIGLKCFVNVTAVIVFICLAVIKPNTKIFHPNTRVIALFISILMFVEGLHNSCFYVMELWRMYYPFRSPCDRVWSSAFVFSVRTIAVILFNGVNSSMAVLCIERLVCICRIKNYEQSSKPVLVALFLFGITALCAIVFGALYLPGVKWDESLAVPSLLNSKNAVNSQILSTYILSLEFVGAFLFLFIHCWSLWYRKRIRGFKSVEHRSILAPIPSNQPLSVKFQIEETIQITSLFLPLVLVRVIIGVIGIIARILAGMIWPNPTADMQMILYELFTVSTLYPFTNAVLLAHGTGQIKRIFSRPSNRTTPIQTAQSEEQDVYFEQLKQLFEANAPQI